MGGFAAFLCHLMKSLFRFILLVGQKKQSDNGTLHSGRFWLLFFKKKQTNSFLILFISIKQFSICFLISCLSLFRCNVYFPTGINTVSLFSYLNSTFYYSACAYCTSRPVSLFILTEMGTLSVFLLRNIKSICHSVNLISSIRLEQNQRSLSSKYNWFNMTMQQQFDSCSPFLTSSSLQFDNTCIFQYTVGIQ